MKIPWTATKINKGMANSIGPSLKGMQPQVKYKRRKSAAARRSGRQLVSIVALTRVAA